MKHSPPSSSLPVSGSGDYTKGLLDQLLKSRQPPSNYDQWISERHAELLGGYGFVFVRQCLNMILLMESKQLSMATVLVNHGVLPDSVFDELHSFNDSDVIKSAAVAATREIFDKRFRSRLPSLNEPAPGFNEDSFADSFFKLLLDAREGPFLISDTEKLLLDSGFDLIAVKDAFDSGVGSATT